MALIDFLGKVADYMASDSMQRRVEDRYQSGKLPKESYDKYRDAVDNYESRKPPKDDYDY